MQRVARRVECRRRRSVMVGLNTLEVNLRRALQGDGDSIDLPRPRRHRPCRRRVDARRRCCPALHPATLPRRRRRRRRMGRGKAVLIRLVSEAGTGFFYTTQKNPIKTPHKLQFLKYDPARQPASTWGFLFRPAPRRVSLLRRLSGAASSSRRRRCPPARNDSPASRDRRGAGGEIADADVFCRARPV